MKKQNMLKVILFTVLAFVVLTWLIPVGTASGTEVISNGLQRIGLFEILQNPIVSFEYFINIVLFIFGVGAFYGVLSKSENYSSAVNRISKALKGKERIALIVVTVFFALLTAVCGFNVTAFALIPLFVTVVLSLGYDRMVGFLVTFGATLMGTIGSVYNYSVTGMLNQYLSLDFGSNLIAKVALLVVPMVVYIFFVDKYAVSVKKSATRSVLDEGKSDVFELVEKPKASSTGMFVILGLLILVLTLAVTPWNTVFGITVFEDLTEAILSFEVGDHAIFSYLLGAVPAFGNYGYEEVLVLLLVASILVAFVSKMNFNDFKEGLTLGLKKTIVPAAVVSIAHTVLILSVYYPIFTTIEGWILGLVKEFNVFAILTTSVTAILGSVFNMDMVYLAQQVTPMVTAFYEGQNELIALIFQSMYGLTSLIAPTSIMLILGLEYLDIPYKTWVKFAFKTILEILVVVLIIVVAMFVI